MKGRYREYRTSVHGCDRRYGFAFRFRNIEQRLPTNEALLETAERNSVFIISTEP